MKGFQEAQAPFQSGFGLLGPAETPEGALEAHDALEDVMAMSFRTYQRLRDQPEKRLDAAASGRLWRFAEILARAADVLGGQKAAEAWLAAPQIGLEQRRPIDLLATRSARLW